MSNTASPPRSPLTAALLSVLAPGLGQLHCGRPVRGHVPPRACFTLGDARVRSVDSRDLGAVPLDDVVGRPCFVFLPAGSSSRFGPLPD